MERFFNTAGPIQPDIHYHVNSLERVDLNEIEQLIFQRKYFVLHAPRQTGKTSMLLALRDYLNQQGRYVAVYANIEAGQAARNNVDSCIATVCETIAERTDSVLRSNAGTELMSQYRSVDSNKKLSTYLKALSQMLDKPLVLFLDEIDALVGDSLVSVLRQIRSGYDQRPSEFPQSIILCGVRDVRDYRIVLSNQDIITGGSAFNIKAMSLRMGNFTREEIRQLYDQHTQETGQQFDDACFDMIWTATEGQPWLVNALGYEVTSEMRENRDRSVRIIPEMMYRAQERIIYRRDTHIDQLIDKLREPRVKRIIEPILAGSDDVEDEIIPTDDLQYCIDLGLITDAKPRRISNAIYREVIPRELTWTTQSGLLQQPEWYRNADRSINMDKLMRDFQNFYRENAEAWDRRFDYREAGPQLLLQAYLQRIINGGGYIDREYGLGMKRTDLMIRQPLTDHYGGPIQKIVIEVKLKYGRLDNDIAKALEQTHAYMERAAGEQKEAHIIIFDRKSKKSWKDKLYRLEREYEGRRYIIWGV